MNDPAAPPSARDSNVAALWALAVLSLIWGYNWVPVKLATFDADPYIVTATRCVLAIVVLFGALLIAKRPLRSPPIVPTIVLGLLQTTGWMILQTLAVALGGAGKTAILAFTMPFWTVLLAIPLLGERLTMARVAALTFAAFGLALILVPVDVAHGLTAKLLAVAAAISWAGSVVYVRRYRAKHSVDLLSLNTWQLVYGTIPVVLIAALVPHHRFMLTPRFVESMLFLSIAGTALGWVPVSYTHLTLPTILRV